MKNTKRLLAIVLALAVLLVSLPMTFAGAATPEVPDTLDNTGAGQLVYAYDFNDGTYASSGSVSSDFIYGGTNSTPKIYFGWGSGGVTKAYMNSYDGKTVLTYETLNCDAVLLAPDVQVKNYVYEATFYSTNSTANAGICNLSWGDTIGSVPGALWFVAKPGTSASSYVSVKGKDIGSGVSVPAIVDNKEIKLTEAGTSLEAGKWYTFKVICYEGVNYYFINDVYYGSVDVSSTLDSYGTGGRVGIYTYGSTMHVSNMSVREYGEVETAKIWDGSFDAALPTADEDGDGEIEIRTAEQFAAVSKSTGKDASGNRIKYELTGDIWLNDTTVDGWKDNSPNAWIDPIKLEDVTGDNTFYGIINGNGYVVRGVYVNKVYAEGEITREVFTDSAYDATAVSGTEYALYEDVYAGLFPSIGKGAALVAIGMEDSYISIRDSAAPITIVKDGSTRDMSLIGSVGLVGVVANSGSGTAIIDQCYINTSVELFGGRTAMIGCGNKTTSFVVSNCYASATITVFRGTSGTGWDNNVGNRFMLISGNDSRPLVYSCYTLGNLTNNGVCDKNVNGVNNVYYYSGWAGDGFATAVDGNAIKGSGAMNVMPNLDWTKFETKDNSRPVLKVFSTHSLGTEGAVWDGTSVEPIKDVDGDGYFEITTAAELRFATGSTNKKYEMVRDIWINDVAVYTLGQFYLADRPIKDWYRKDGWFNGQFNGNGKTVYGLVVDKPVTNESGTYTGLFDRIGEGKTIKCLGLENSFIQNGGNYCVGGMIGAVTTNNVTIDTCYVGEDVFVYSYSGTGGFVGGNNNKTLTFKNCYSLAYVKHNAGNGKIAGFVGDTWTNDANKFINCYTNNAKLMGQSRTVTGSSAYYSTSGDNGSKRVSLDKMLGMSALANMSELNSGGAYLATNGYPILKIFDPDYVEEEEVGEVWNGSIAATYAGGTGTENDPYIISKGSQLAKAINSFGENGAYFKLDRDIYLNDVTKENWTEGANYWFTGNAGTDANGYTYNSYKSKVSEVTKTGNVGIFSGNIDGNGFHVYGVCYPSDTASYASSLIPAVAGGTFKNLGLDNFAVFATDTAAAMFAFSNKYTAPIVVDNCYIGQNISITANDAKGGFFGYANGNNGSNTITIKNSYVLIPAVNLGGYGTKNCAFISETWLTSYYMSNCYSVAQPINPGGAKERASTAYADDLSKISSVLSNVFCLENGGIEFGNYEKYDDGNGNVTKAFTTLASSEMRGTKVFDKMTINGEGAFLYNIGYPSLVLFGNTVPTEEELLEGLTNVGTMNENAGTFTVPTSALVYSTTVTAGALEELNIGGKYFFQITETGAMVLAGEETVNKQLTLSGTVNVKIYVVGGFMIAFVNDECVGLVSVSVAPNTSFTKAGANVSAIDLYIADATFDGITFGDVNLQLKDNLGNATTGGVKLDVNLTESDAINDFGYETEYGVLLVIGDKVVSDITADGAVKYVMKDAAQNFEITGLGTAKQELFFALRGYAKIKVTDEIDYYYYGSTTTVFSPIYEANDLYANENYADAIKAVYGASDKFIENYDGDIEFATFGDYHYKTGMYTSILSDMKAVVDTAKTLNDGQGADFILSLGDMTNDMKGSKEVTNYLLDGKYSFRGTEIAKDHNLTFFNLYGNHELESTGNTMDIVSPTLTNSTAAHWGDGTVGRVPANNQYGYYYADVNGFRLIVIDTNYSWNPNHINGEVVGWEHNLTASYGSPLAPHNALRGFDEGAAALANSNTNSLGPVQLEWLDGVLMDAVEKGIPCIVAGHESMSGTYSGGADSKQVRALYKKANDIRTGTVLASLNGHLHTNRTDVVEGVLYLDINTVRNSEWRGTSEAHYDSSHAFTIDYYDDNGNYLSSSASNLNALGMGKQTWFANDPIYSTVKITQRGAVELTGCRSKYMYDVIPEGYKNYAYPGQNSGYWNLGDAEFTVTDIVWPQ